MKLLAFTLLLFTTTAFAAKQGEHHPTPKIAPAFEKMKELVGTYDGKTVMNGKEMPVTVEYKLTSGGTTLVETMGPGTPHEMVTVYSTRGGSLVQATHYCMAGNQPQMKLKKADGKTFVFEMDGTKGISNKNEMHMHSVALTLDGKNLTQEWTNYADGKKAETATFKFIKR